MSDSAATEAAPTFRKVQFGLSRNMKYHEMREAWLSFCSRSIKVISLVSGTTATAVASSSLGLSGLPIIACLGVVISILQMIDLLFDLAGQARRHAELKSKFSDLRTRLLKGGDNEARRKSLYAEMHSIVGLSPATYNIVAMIAWNETYRSLFAKVSNNDLIPLSRYQLIFAHLYRCNNFDSRTLAERTAGMAAPV